MLRGLKSSIDEKLNKLKYTLFLNTEAVSCEKSSKISTNIDIDRVWPNLYKLQVKSRFFEPFRTSLFDGLLNV